MSLRGNEPIGQAEWARHWRIPLISAAASAVSVTHLNSVGVILPAIRQEYHWPVTQVVAGLTLLSIVALLLSGWVGAAVDRWGSRRIGMAGVAIYCAGFAALSTAGPSIWSWWLLWLAISCGYVCTTGTVWTPAIARRFSRHRGLAIAVMLCGNGVSAAALPFITTVLVERYGWRGAFIGIGAVEAGCVLPLLWLFFKDRIPVGERPVIVDAPPVPGGLSFRDAIRSPHYVKIAVAALLFTMATTGLVVHFVPILRETGLAPRAAALTAGGIGIGAIVGRLVTGILLDHLHGPVIGGIAFSLPVAALALLLSHPTPAASVVIALLIGLALGSELDVVAYVATRYFGLRHLGVILGTIVGLISFGGGMGPLASGIMFDLFGNYHAFILALIVPLLISAALIASLGPYPPGGFIRDRR